MVLTESELKHQICAAHCDDKTLEELTLKFKHHIKSQRRCDAIKSVQDLINILERRAVLDVETLREISNHVHCSLNSNILQNCVNLNLSEREDHNSEVLQSEYNRVYLTIANEIGRKWKDFARALNIKEGKIDELESRHAELQDRVIEILRIHKSQFVFSNNRALQTAILNALTTVRRNDLREKVEHILDNLQ